VRGERPVAEFFSPRNRTMIGFALYSGAKIGLKYDCETLPKNREKCFSCGGKLSGERKEGGAMAHGIVNGKPLTDKGNQEYQQQETTPPSQEQARREEQEQEGIGDRAKALALKLARTYEELTRLLERNPAMKRQITEGEAREDKVYQKLKQRLKMADMAPRCQWVRQDGTSCRSPQMKQHIYCFAHMQMAEARTLMLMLPAAEDANAIQVGLMRIQKALLEDTISTKKAGLLLYSMQLALTNVGQTTFGQAKDEEMVRETVDEEEAFSEKALSRQHSAVSEKQGQDQRPFTAKDAEGAKEHQGLPLMNTDDTDFEEAHGEDGSGDVEFVPVPGGYGFERVRLRIGPELGGQKRPVQTTVVPEGKTAPPRAAVPHECTQVHNSSPHDERLPIGPRFAIESLTCDTSWPRSHALTGTS
jgi:hypothetical protein